MCIPPAVGLVASVAMSAASSMASYSASQQSYAAQLQRYNENYQDALADNRTDETQLTDREMQEQQAYSQKDHLAAVEGATKKAQVAVAAAAGGVSGPSVAALTNGIGMQINTKRATLETNWQNTAEQLQSQKTTAVEQEESRIGQVADPYSPSPLGAIASFGGAALKDASSPTGVAGVSQIGSAASSAFAGAGGGLSLPGM